MKRLFALALATFALSLYAETPKEGAQAILSLLKADNYTELFTTRYSEWYKVEAEKVAQDQAVQKLSTRWKKQKTAMVSLYEQLSTAEYELSVSSNPQTSETGDIANATVLLGENKVPYKLYKMKSGLWGFHM